MRAGQIAVSELVGIGTTAPSPLLGGLGELLND
jgi:hypothetical protein